MTGPFFTFQRSTLQALAQRTEARYRGAYDSHASQLIRQIEPRLLGQWGASPLEVIRWHWPGEGRAALILLSAKPINGPLSCRLLGLYQPVAEEPGPSNALLLGPIRWETIFEARLVPPEYFQLPLPSLLAGLPVQVMGDSAGEAYERVQRMRGALLLSFLAAEGHLLHVGARGAWFIAPDIRQARARDRMFALLTQLRAHYPAQLPYTPPPVHGPALVHSR